MRFTEKSKWCLLKKLYQVMRGVLHINFLPHRFTFAILEFLFDNAEKDSVWYHMQVKQGNTPTKCYFWVFLLLVTFSKTGAGIWMKMVEMEEIGI